MNLAILKILITALQGNTNSLKTKIPLPLAVNLVTEIKSMRKKQYNTLPVLQRFDVRNRTGDLDTTKFKPEQESRIRYS